MKKEFSIEQKIEVEKIQFLLTYQKELNLDKTDIELLKQKRNEFVEIVRSKYYRITEEEIDELFNECTPLEENYEGTLEYYIFDQSSEFYDVITIDPKDQNQPVLKNEKDYDDSSVLEQMRNKDQDYLSFYRMFSK